MGETHVDGRAGISGGQPRERTSATAEQSDAKGNQEVQASFSVVVDPDHIREQVMAYVRELDDEDSTGGYMMRMPLSTLSFRVATRWSGTGRSEWDTNGLKDMGCGDSDQ